jgi:hypothetical protein
MDNVIAPRDTTQEPEDDNDLIFKGLREDYPDLKDVDDDILVDTIHEGEFPDVKDQKEFTQMLHDAYVPKKTPLNFGAITPTEAPKPKGASVWGAVGKGIADMGHQIASSFASPIDAAAEYAHRGAFEKPVDELEAMPDYQGLIQRGYSPKIARHIMEQRIGTMQDLNASNEAEAELGKSKAVEGTATYLSTAASMGLAGALGAGGAVASGVESAISPLNVGLSESAMQTLASKGLAGAAKHAIEGAAGLMGYEAVKAAAEGKSAGEICDLTVYGTTNKAERSIGQSPAVQGALFGVSLPIAVKGVGKVLGKVVNTAQLIPRYIEQKVTRAAKAQIAALAAQADNFAEKFNADHLRTRYEDLARAHDGQPSTILAGRLIKDILGEDVLANASAESILKLAEKIKMQRRYIGIDPGMGSTRPIDRIVSPEGFMTIRDDLGMPEPDPLQVINMLAQEQMPGMLPPGVDPMNPPVGGMVTEGTLGREGRTLDLSPHVPQSGPLGALTEHNAPGPMNTQPMQDVGNLPSEAGGTSNIIPPAAPQFEGTWNAWEPQPQQDINAPEIDLTREYPFGATTGFSTEPRMIDLPSVPAEPRLDYRPLPDDPTGLPIERPTGTTPSGGATRNNPNVIMPSTKRGVDLGATKGLDATPPAKKSAIVPAAKEEPKKVETKKTGPAIQPSKDYSPTKVNKAEEAIRKNRSTLETAAKDFNLNEAEHQKLKERMGVKPEPAPKVAEPPKVDETTVENAKDYKASLHSVIRKSIGGRVWEVRTTKGPVTVDSQIFKNEEEATKELDRLIKHATPDEIEHNSQTIGNVKESILGGKKTVKEEKYLKRIKNVPQETTEPAPVEAPKKLPYNPPKENKAERGSTEWFTNTLEDLRHGYIDMPDAKMQKGDYASATPTPEELHNNLAHRRNKRTTAWHQAVASFSEMVAAKIEDPKIREEIEKASEHILTTRDSTKPTTTEEVKFADDLLDKVLKALKEK